MSSTCQDIIKLAAEIMGIIPAGGTPETADNLRIHSQLKAYYQSLINDGAFGALDDVPIPDGVTIDAAENTRYVHGGTATVNLPLSYALTYETTQYGSTSLAVDTGHVRPPADLALVSVVRTDTGAVADYIYDNRARKWFELTNLATTDVAPLSHRDANGLACSLAMLCNPLFFQNAQLPQTIAARAARFEEALTHNYSQAGEWVQRVDYF